jgi:Predicted proline hydroxylase
MSIADTRNLFLSRVERFSSPFCYFTSILALNPNLAAKTLAWLETAAPWKLTKAAFYEQYEFSFWNASLPNEIDVLISDDFIKNLKTEVSLLFDTDLDERIDIAAHKLIHGQRIRLHNDFISGGETHRILIQLNRGWKAEHGGLLLLFNSSDPADIHKAFCPIHNTAIGFEISLRSNHAVSSIHHGQRFTLVYSFYGKKR